MNVSSPSHIPGHPEERPPEEPKRATIRLPKTPPSGRIVPRPDRREPCRMKRTDCCDQLLAILRQVPGIDPKLLHKPKIPNRVKIDCLCRYPPTKDSIVPILFHILERCLAQEQPADNVEMHLFTVLKIMPEKGLEAMKSSLAAYKALPEEKRLCLFRKEFVEWPLDKPISPEIIAGEWISEGLDFAGDVFHPLSGGAMGPAKVRPWSITTTGAGIGSEEFGTMTQTAPWPWLCAVSTAPDRELWFRNTDFKPQLKPGDIQPHEIDQVCTYSFDPDELDKVVEDCNPKKPSQSADALFSSCDGGPTYTMSDVCLKIPDAIPGQTIRLRGFNFFSDKCRARITKVDASITYPDVPVVIWPDLADEHWKDSDGKVIADCRVHDETEFEIPKKHPDGFATFVPGRYEVRLIVPNDGNHSVINDIGDQPSQPAEFVSNAILLNILPDQDIKYRIWNDGGYCYEETDGPGADEIWWTAGVATFTPGQDQTINLDLDVLKIPHNPWDDMDSGESTEPSTYAAVDFLNGSALAVAIVLIGFEVDSEAAAKEQIDNWGDAFGLYVTEAWKVLASGGAIAEAVDIVKLIGLTWSLIAAAAAVVLVAVIGFIWAAWAPADLIAADLLVWTSGQLFSLTDTKTPLAKEYSGESISGIDVTVRPQNKVPPFNGASFARYNEERRYRSEDEDSLYGLNIHVERVPEA